jgi:hypothetical protein
METTLSKLNSAFDDLWEKHAFLITLLICALLFDTVSTILFMVDEGIEFEIHPFVRYSASLLGPVTGTVLSAFIYKFVIGLLLAMYLRKIRTIILIAPAVTSTIAGFLNIYMYR